MVPLKYLNNFWRTLEMPLINCEIELILTWSRNCIIISTDIDNQIPTFTITETNFYVPVVTFTKELHKPIIRKFKKRKVYSGFIDNIVDIFCKYAWVVPLKERKRYQYC